MRVTRDEVAAQVRAWQAGALATDELLAWVRVRYPDDRLDADGDVTREALADLDLLAVHLLTSDDAPALLALLAAPPDDARAAAAAVAEFRRYRDAIDRVTRSRALRKVPLYRPFCR